ncbi:hypothetical protein [Burkholderia contaminans]|uniref:hypothetical protein n=1 Tax=Burkholderia contaminans TaxID=488447 RepID=UPI00158DC00F|nr:hypothetical protein [Burkholderia contaminans]
MKKLGVNQQLEQLFLQVLDKPEYEGKLHQFGNFSLMFNRVNRLVRNKDDNKILEEESGFYINLYEYAGRRDGAPSSIYNSFAKNFKDILRTDATGGFLERFREQFTKYLNSVELHDKLQHMPEKEARATRVKI